MANQKVLPQAAQSSFSPISTLRLKFCQRSTLSDQKGNDDLFKLRLNLFLQDSPEKKRFHLTVLPFQITEITPTYPTSASVYNTEVKRWTLTKKTKPSHEQCSNCSKLCNTIIAKSIEPNTYTNSTIKKQVNMHRRAQEKLHLNSLFLKQLKYQA